MTDRLRRIVDEMRIRPNDLVLEIGCGHGVAASFICEQLQTGYLVAIDRSAKMIGAAMRRNAGYVKASRAQFVAVDVRSFDPGARKFDKILAVRVGLLHREPSFVRDVVGGWLASGGRMFVVYDEPTKSVARVK